MSDSSPDGMASSTQTDTLHEGPGCMVHIPAVIDSVTGLAIALTLNATLSVTWPDGHVRTFARIQSNVLTSSVGFNLFLPETTPPVV